MKIYKFGGASVKDAEGVKNVAQIITGAPHPLVIVVSAMSKTTNALEVVLQDYMQGDTALLHTHTDEVWQMHQQILRNLFEPGHSAFGVFHSLFAKLTERLSQPPSLNYDFEYDQIVSYGELLSTLIVSLYLHSQRIENQWIDIRQCLKTDEIYRDAGILWDLTTPRIQETFDAERAPVYLTQGFIGSTINNLTTTLGREGSDYTAAILGHILNAVDVTIWKDVPGVLTADPRWYPQARLLPELSYLEAIELTYYGAQVIHPKTLKPLQNKGIPLRVRSFVTPGPEGTVIHEPIAHEPQSPIVIRKTGQTFLSVSPKDFSFIMEDNLSDIFAILGKLRIKVNLIQNSALNFSVCIDSTHHFDELVRLLGERYHVRYNTNLELINIRHYNAEIIGQITRDKEVIDSQITRKSARYVLKATEWKF